MAMPRHLNHAPITEALIDIHVEHRDDLSFGALQDTFSSLDFGYYFKNPISRGTFGFRFTSDGQQPQTTVEAAQIGLRLHSDDEKYVAQFRLAGFTLSRLPPYEAWPALVQETKRIWLISTHRLPSNVRPHESLSSFVFRPAHVVTKSRTIHPTSLMPRRDRKTRRLEVSVCRSQSLSETQVWEICKGHFDVHAPKPAIGRGVGPAEAVFKVSLRFDADGELYPEHANIIGWRDLANTPDSEQKHFWMDQAQRMAPAFRYLPRPKAD